MTPAYPTSSSHSQNASCDWSEQILTRYEWRKIFLFCSSGLSSSIMFSSGSSDRVSFRSKARAVTSNCSSFR